MTGLLLLIASGEGTAFGITWKGFGGGLVTSFGGWSGVVGCGLGGVGWVVGLIVFEGFSWLALGFGDFEDLAVLTVLAVERGVF